LVEENQETTGFSRVVIQFSPNHRYTKAFDDTTDFSRVETRLFLKHSKQEKVKFNDHATEVGGMNKNRSCGGLGES